MNYACQIEDGYKGFEGHEVFSNLDIKVCQGEMVAITGKSGSGKTTLLNIVGTLDKLDKGTQYVCGTMITKDLDRSRYQRFLLREKISFIFQNYGLVENESVEWNMALPLAIRCLRKSNRRKMIEQSLERVGLSISLNQKVYELSGGEQQRIAIARTLLKPSEIILCDEPTGSLDRETGSLIMRLICEMKQSKTIIIASHDDDVIRRCDKKIQLM